MAHRLILAAAAAFFAAAALLFGGLFRSNTPDPASGALPEAVAAELARGFAAGDTQVEILGLQRELELDPHNVKALDTLGLAYLQRVRETGDPTYYPKAQGILEDALQQSPRDLSQRRHPGSSRSRATSSIRRSRSASGRGGSHPRRPACTA